MPIGTIYQVKQFGTLYSQNTLNVWFYEMTADGAPDDAEGLFDAFDQDILVHMVGTVLDQYDILRVEVFAPAVPTDFFDDVPVNNQGTRSTITNERSPSYSAYGLRSNRAGPGTRSSYKRFSGLQEADMDANSLKGTFTGLQAVLDLAQAMGTTINASGGGAVYKPVQVKHPIVLDVAPVKNFDIDNWGTAYLTSQVSRRAPAGT